ncbi:glutamate decarboxylase [Panaeolus papilionaceus]|nr:glutamate decarboxylase [Panaeolus papilionaceus]
MALAQAINPDRLIQLSRDRQPQINSTQSSHKIKTYADKYQTNPAPKYHLAEEGISPDAAYNLITDELSLDGSTILNLASFVNTWMPPQANQLFQENVNKNLIDTDEYPSTHVIHTRCISILASMWNAPSSKDAIGTATTGSSEAIQLGGLAMKRMWQASRKAAGKSIHEPGPNIIMGANAQVALEKFARYFDVECRLVPVDDSTHYCLDAKRAMEYIDENTIGVYVILGSTYTGHYEPVKEMATLLNEYQSKTGTFVPIHVDAASGGFVAPFLQPKLDWDFRVDRVVSINTSGHKFGLSYVGVGWVVWRDKAHLPKDLIFELHYLGSVQYSFSLNFSRPAAPIIGQYFNFLHLGHEGYRVAALQDQQNARLLSRALENTGYFMVISDIHRATGRHVGPSIESPDIGDYEPGLPVVAFRFTDDFRKTYPDIQQSWIQTLLRAKGWIVPNYPLPPNVDNVEILRVVIRINFTEVMIEMLLGDILSIVKQLISSDTPMHSLITLGNVHTNQRPEFILTAYEKESIKDSGGDTVTYARPC